jgi:TfoX N-terminal domain
MFGGVCFTVGGNMCCGVTGSDLMVRVGPDQHPAALARPHARPMDFTGRPLRGFVFVGPKGTARLSQVAAWIELVLTFTATLPPKRPRSTKSRGRPR